MKLNVLEIKLLQHVLRSTGEKVDDGKGNEVSAPRTLNGEESSQRRHFNKNTQAIIEALNNKLKEFIDAHNLIVKETKEKIEKTNKKKLDEKELDALVSKDKTLLESFQKVSDEIKILNEEKHEVEITDKTLAVIKKYYKEYADKIGWVEGDDETVESLEEVLK